MLLIRSRDLSAIKVKAAPSLDGRGQQLPITHQSDTVPARTSPPGIVRLEESVSFSPLMTWIREQEAAIS